LGVKKDILFLHFVILTHPLKKFLEVNGTKFSIQSHNHICSLISSSALKSCPTFELPFQLLLPRRHLNNKNNECSNEVAVLLIVLWQSLLCWKPSFQLSGHHLLCSIWRGQKWLRLAAGNRSNCLPHATHRPGQNQNGGKKSRPNAVFNFLLFRRHYVA